MLELRNVTKNFGALFAVKNVSLSIGPGEIVGLIGPNGAGKTTLFNCISGLIKPTSGIIAFDGDEITRLHGFPSLVSNQVAKMGIGRTFQIPRPLNRLSVFDNVLVGAHSVPSQDRRALTQRCLEDVGLQEKSEAAAKDLVFAEKRKLELARALAMNPKLILVDEFAAGLSPTEATDAVKLLQKLRSESGISFFWVEHIMKAIMGGVDRVIVMSEGEKIAEGSCTKIACDPQVVSAYLGEKYAL